MTPVALRCGREPGLCRKHLWLLLMRSTARGNCCYRYCCTSGRRALFDEVVGDSGEDVSHMIKVARILGAGNSENMLLQQHGNTTWSNILLQSALPLPPKTLLCPHQLPQDGPTLPTTPLDKGISLQLTFEAGQPDHRSR